MDSWAGLEGAFRILICLAIVGIASMGIGFLALLWWICGLIFCIKRAVGENPAAH